MLLGVIIYNINNILRMNLKIQMAQQPGKFIMQKLLRLAYPWGVLTSQLELGLIQG